MPVFYECQRCGACCRWPGPVRLSDAEVTRLAGFCGATEWDFIQRFTRLADDRRGLALEEKPDGACVFLDGNTCRVELVKPRQCRDFPNGWRCAGFAEHCQAAPRWLDEETFAARMQPR